MEQGQHEYVPIEMLNCQDKLLSQFPLRAKRLLLPSKVGDLMSLRGNLGGDDGEKGRGSNVEGLKWVPVLVERVRFIDLEGLFV